MNSPDDDSVPADPSPEKPRAGGAEVRGMDAAELFDLVDTGSIPPAAWTPLPSEELEMVLPDYQILGLIGRGGMGAVYRARQLSLGRVVAVKVLPAEAITQDPVFEQRFRREARILSRLRHPGIVGLFEFGSTLAGDLYFTMELVAGESLAARLATGKLGQNETLALLRQVCEAVAYAHGEGIIHRDLKPANILIATDGRVKVVDFGLAIAESRPTSEKFTRSGIIIGTVDYLAPEQWQGRGGDVRSDIFSLGVITFELLTGEVPRGVFDPPSFRRSNVDPVFDEVILRALQMEPESRYGSVAEFQQALQTAHETALLRGSWEVMGPSQAALFEEFYENAVSGLPEAVRIFIEDKLLTPSGYRDSRALDDVLAFPGFSREALEQLVGRRFLRVEQRTGVPRVEISHDRLTGAIQASRDARRLRDHEAMARREQSRQRRISRIRLAAVAVTATVLCLGGWMISCHRELRLQAAHESGMRRQTVRALLDMVSGPFLQKVIKLGRVSLLDPVHQNIETTLEQNPPGAGDTEFYILKGRLLKSRGYVQSVRGFRAAASRSLENAFHLFSENGAEAEALDCGLLEAESLLDQGRPEEARAVLEKQARPLLPASSGKMADVLPHARLTRLLSRTLQELGQEQRAVSEARAAAALLLSLGGQDDGSTPGEAGRELALAESTLAQALDKAENASDEALALHRSADLRMRSSAQAGADDFLRQMESAELRGTYAAALLARNRPVEGTAEILATVDFTRSLVVRDPDNIPWRLTHAAALGWLGQRFREAGMTERAIQVLDESISTARLAAAVDPLLENGQWTLAANLLQYGYLHDGQGQYPEAEPFFREAVEIMFPFASSPDTALPDRIAGLDAARRELGLCLEKQQRPADALAYYLEWEQRALENTARSPFWWFPAMESAEEAAGVFRQMGDIAGSLQAFRRALAHFDSCRRVRLPTEVSARALSRRASLATGILKTVKLLPSLPSSMKNEARYVAQEAVRVLFPLPAPDTALKADEASLRSALEKAAASF